MAFLGVLFLGFQIRSQRSDARAGWTLSYQATYNDRAFRTIASKCTGFFDAHDAADCVNKIRAIRDATWADASSLPRTPATADAARASVNDLSYVLGFFETLGAAYNDRKLARRLIDDDFATPAVWFFVDAWWYICWRRDGQSARTSHLYEQFEGFVTTTRARQSGLESRAKPKRKIRLICIPAQGAGNDGWALAAKLSNALSDRACDEVNVLDDIGVPESLVSQLEHVVNAIEGMRDAALPGSADRVETVIAVPSDINVVEDVWRHHRKRAERIQCLLSRLSVAELDLLVKLI